MNKVKKNIEKLNFEKKKKKKKTAKFLASKDALKNSFYKI